MFNILVMKAVNNIAKILVRYMLKVVVETLVTQGMVDLVELVKTLFVVFLVIFFVAMVKNFV